MDLVICVLVEEVLFYYSHRLLHSRWFYGRVHKQHHEYKAPVGMAAIYAHPLEFAASDLVSRSWRARALGANQSTRQLVSSSSNERAAHRARERTTKHSDCGSCMCGCSFLSSVCCVVQLPLIAGPLLARSHMLSMWLWYAVAIFTTIQHRTTTAPTHTHTQRTTVNHSEL